MAYDHILATNAQRKDEKGKIVRQEYRFGGNVRNSLVAAASLGATCAYVGTMSGDEKWKHALDDYAQNSVSTEFVEFSEKSYPAEATIFITGDGERFIIYDDTPLHHLRLPSEEKVARAISAAKLLLVDAGTAPPGSLEVMKRCAELNIPIILDAEQFFVEKSLVLQMIEVASDLILPLHFAQVVTGKQAVGAVIEALWSPRRNLVALTEGAKGCYFKDNDGLKTQHMNAYQIEAIDTNGTGDIFHGSYAYSYLKGAKSVESLKFASAAAAAVASQPHGSIRKPKLEDINKFITSNSELIVTAI